MGSPYTQVLSKVRPCLRFSTKVALSLRASTVTCSRQASAVGHQRYMDNAKENLHLRTFSIRQNDLVSLIHLSPPQRPSFPTVVTSCSGLDLKGPHVKGLVPSVALWGGCDTFRKREAHQRLLRCMEACL